MDVLTIVLITIIATIAVGGIGMAIYNSRKAGNTAIPWDKIRPIVTHAINEGIALSNAKKGGYGAVEDYTVRFIKKSIDSADFLEAGEKLLMTEDFIRSIIRPTLKELYEKKV